MPDPAPDPGLSILRDGLHRSGARLPLASNIDVIGWLLEKAGEGHGAE